MERVIKNYWWKILGASLVLYSILFGFFVQVPDLPIVHESIRNIFFHVCMWFAMIVIFATSLVYSIKYLSGFDLKNDVVAGEAANVGLLFGFIGILTGMFWARNTWGAWWVNDVQLNGAAVTILAYIAYLILRGSIEEIHLKAKVAAVYNIFAFVMLLVFIGILPRVSVSSIHPQSNNSSPFSVGSLDNTMRLVFYPAIVGWILIGVWILQLRIRYKKIKEEIKNIE